MTGVSEILRSDVRRRDISGVSEFLRCRNAVDRLVSERPNSAREEIEEEMGSLPGCNNLNEKGWYRRAISNLRTVTQMEPKNADAWNELGFAYRNVENYRQSARAYDRALGIEPNHLGALN